MGVVPDLERDFLDSGTISSAGSALLGELSSRLAGRLDEIARGIVSRFAADMTAGGLISEDDAHTWVLSVMRTVTLRFADPAADLAPERQVIEELTRDRATLGFPLDSLLRSFQLGARALLEVLDAEAGAQPDLDVKTLLEVHDYCWEWANQAMSVVAATHRQVAVDVARRDSAQRAEFLRGVLLGHLTGQRLLAEAQLFGLADGVDYHAIRARPHDEHESAELELAVLRSGSSDTQRAVVAVLDGDVVGLTPRQPRVDGALVAIGPSAALTTAPASFAEATEALETAHAFGIAGAVRLAELGPLPLARAGALSAQRLAELHLADLDRHDRHHEVQRTMLVLLDHDQDVRAAAATLHVHPNTVRYRAGRFRDLTGLDINRTEDLIVAWWLLKRRQAVA
jgi:hypothetical protein